MSLNLYAPCKKSIYIKDSVHNYIKIEKKIIQEIVDCKELQRLRYINQLGITHLVFPDATHTRFSHSLGAYEISRKIIAESKYFKDRTYEKMLFMITALVHDIGHGPISHHFEQVFTWFDHEKMGTQIIRNSQTEIHNILLKYDPNLISDVCDLINKKSKYNSIQQLISSDVDVDRMDYLLRDSQHTSHTLGAYDLSRLINGMIITQENVVFKLNTLNVLEDFLLGRFHMYNQIYVHKKSLILDNLMTLYLNKKVEYQLINEKSNLYKFLKTKKTHYFLNLNDYSIYEELMNESSHRLKHLAEAIYYRKDSEYINKVPIDKQYSKGNLIYDPSDIKPKAIYKNGILIKKGNEILDLEEISEIISLIKQAKISIKGEFKYYVTINNQI